MSPLYAYGLYLSNGGSPKDFFDMDLYDIQAMLSVYKGEKARDKSEHVTILTKMITSLFGKG